MIGNFESCYGRYLGPDKLIETSSGFGAEYGSRELLVFLETYHILIPILRYREPNSILVARLQEEHPEAADLELMAEPEGSRVDAVVQMDQLISAWGQPRRERSPVHPFDDPPPGSAFLFEDPRIDGITPDTYGPIPIGRLGNGEPMLNKNACLPLYRDWQALQLMEVVNETGLRLHFPDWNGADSALFLLWGHEAVVPEFMNCYISRGHHSLEGFQRHYAALEAASWFHAYANRALQFADSQNTTGGFFTITGQALQELRAAESKVAIEACERFSADDRSIAGMTMWAGEMALEYRRRGRPKSEAGYRKLVGDGLDLLFARGVDHEAAGQLANGLSGVLEQLYPNWVEEQRGRALSSIQHVILPELATNLSPLLTPPDVARAREFLGWLEIEGLSQVYWHFDELTSMSDRFDTIGLVGVAREVACMASSVEHICNALGCAPNTLFPKLEGYWREIRAVSTILLANVSLTRTGAPTFGQATERFNANLAEIQTSIPATPEGLVSRDLLTTVLVRNHALHNGLPTMNKADLINLFMCMLRAAFLTWHVKTPAQPPS